MPQDNCALCGSGDLFTFFRVENLPVHCAILWRTPAAALGCPKGNLALYLCRQCGLIGNGDFRPELLEYSEEYDNSLHHSPLYQDYARQEGQRLIDKYRLRGKTLVEVGCGKGDFLALLCELGGGTGIGFDPSYAGKFSDREKTGELTFIRDFFSPRYREPQGDFVYSRHVLEHIPQPVPFLARLRGAIREGGSLYIEVPNSAPMLENRAVWEMLYEHCSYFTELSLSNCLRAAGFAPQRMETTFGGINLTAEALPVERPLELYPEDPRLQSLENSARELEAVFADKADGLKMKLDRFTREGKKVAAWGGGARATTLINVLGLRQELYCVVDLNPQKQRRFLGGGGQPIVAPAFLRESPPDAVLIVNSVYGEEIVGLLNEMDLHPEVIYS